LNDATNSSGDLQNAQNTYLGTAAAKWTQLGATMDTVFQNMVDATALKDIIGGLVDLASDLGNIQTILAAVGMAVGIFAGKALMGITETIGAWVAGSVSFIESSSLMTFALSAVGTAMDKLDAALDTNPIGVIAIAIMVCVTAYDLLHKTVQDQIDVFTNDTTKIQNEMKCVQDLTDSLNIMNKVDAEGTNASAKDKQQLIDNNNTLAQTYPQLITGYDAETQSFIIDKKALDALIESKKKNAMQDNADMIASAQATQQQAQQAIQSEQAELKSNTGQSTTNRLDQTTENTLTPAERTALTNEISANNALITASGDTLNQGIKFIDDYVTASHVMGESDAQNKQNKQEAINTLLSLGYSMTTINTDLAKSTTAINGQTSAMSALSQSTATFNTQEEALATTFKNAEQETEDLNDLTAKMHDGQKLSASDVADLIIKYPELAGAVKGSAGAYTIEQSAIDNLNKANIAGAQTTINTEISNTKATLEGLAPRLKAYGIEIDAINSVAAAKIQADKIINSVTTTHITKGKLGSWNPIGSGYTTTTSAPLTADQQTMQNAVNQYGALQDQANALNKLLSDPTFGVTSSDTTSPSTGTTTATGTTAADKKLATAQAAVDAGTATAAQTKLVTDAAKATTSAGVTSATTVASAQKTASDAIIAGYQAQINAINAKTAAEAKATQQLQAQNQLVQDQANLKTAQNEKNVQYINAAGQWAWEANQSAVQTAQAAVTADKTSQSQTNTANATQNALDSLNAKITAQQNKATLGGYASGTDYVPQTGSYIVGEKGQEEVVLPQGAQVIPNDQLGSTDASSSASSNNSSSDTDSSNVNNSSTVKQSVTDLINSVNTSIETFVNNSPQFGKDTDNNIGQAILNNEELIKEPLDNLVSDLTNDIETFVNNSPEFAKDTENNIGQSITTNEALLTAPLDVLIAKIQTGIATFVTGSYAYGTGTVTEMGKGMTDSTKNITDVVKTLTGKIVTQFQTSLGIASPSKVSNIAV